MNLRTRTSRIRCSSRRAPYLGLAESGHHPAESTGRGSTMSNHETEGRTMRTRRVSQGVALMVAAWAFVIANTGGIVTAEAGQDDTTPRGAILISAAHPLADKLFTFAAMVGCLLLVPAVLGAMGLVRVKAAR